MRLGGGCALSRAVVGGALIGCGRGRGKLCGGGKRSIISHQHPLQSRASLATCRVSPACSESRAAARSDARAGRRARKTPGRGCGQKGEWGRLPRSLRSALCARCMTLPAATSRRVRARATLGARGAVGAQGNPGVGGAALVRGAACWWPPRASAPPRPRCPVRQLGPTTAACFAGTFDYCAEKRRRRAHARRA